MRLDQFATISAGVIALVMVALYPFAIPAALFAALAGFAAMSWLSQREGFSAQMQRIQMEEKVRLQKIKDDHERFLDYLRVGVKPPPEHCEHAWGVKPEHPWNTSLCVLCGLERGPNEN